MNRPVVVGTRADLDAALDRHGAAGGRVVLVPTMGALHQGHARLMDVAASAGDATVVSIFVNPLQFGPGEDFERYPRTLDADLGVCAAHGVDVVLAPTAAQMYAHGRPQVTVDAGPLGDELEGSVRPGHFAGVLTIVAKLLNVVRPDTVVFGEKDYQQLVMVRRMVADLDIGVEVVGVPTVREPDGLALSSRNRYLDSIQRRTAATLSAALRAGAAAAAEGCAAAEDAARAVLARTPDVAVDYLVVRDLHLGRPPPYGEARMLVAARVGSTRLIDNLPLRLGKAEQCSAR